MKQILTIQDLQIAFTQFDKEYYVVKNLSFDLELGESLAIVGESGSGKSVTAKSILGLNPPSFKVKSGKILYQGRDLLTLSEKALQKVRGSEIGIIFQDSMTSLNPTMRIGKQIEENLCKNKNALPLKDPYTKSIELLKLVGIRDPKSCYYAYPHELSGGMRQRVMIAITLAPKPKILIADEPTTALDVTIQKQILHLLGEIQKKLLMSIIFITHDLSLVSHFCSKILVMYAGSLVEIAKTKELFQNPKHPYTARLLKSIPTIHQDPNHPLLPINGSPPSIFERFEGCSFCPRCPHALRICKKTKPLLCDVDGSNTEAACWLYDPRCTSREKELV